MKLHLPKTLRAALLAALALVAQPAMASVTYDNLTQKDYFVADEHVYNTGAGKFYLETPSCDLNLTLTLNVNDFAAYQAVHDYANSGNYSPFVTWTYNNNAGATYGMADVASGYTGVSYSGVTGYWAGKPWSTGTNITLDTLKTYADKDGNVSLTINNTPVGTTQNVVVRAQDNTVLYTVNGLRSQDYVNQHITSFTVNMNYVKSVTLNTDSILDSSQFTPPKDYTLPFVSERTDGSSVGRVLCMGDSITHGVEDMSWRWGLFKTLVDNDIENELAGPLSGYHSTPKNTDYKGDTASTPYGGQVFENVHYAQASGRTHNMLTAGSSQNVFGNSTGVNYGGVSSAKVGQDYNADTYIMMMGTNDILSDGASTAEKMATLTERLLGAGEVKDGAWVNADKLSALVGRDGTDPSTAAHTGKWGTMGKIIDNLKMGSGDTMYVMSIPTWAQGRGDIRVYANVVPDYNENLKLWTKAYSDSHTGTVKYVDVNRGLVDKTLNGTFLGPNDFFRTANGDYLHPNEQGSLIIAGNLAQGMEIGGRTAGLKRSATNETGWTSFTEASVTMAAGQSSQLLHDVFIEDGGYTIDFGAVFGNGAEGGWLDKSYALSVSVGDGSNSGTLNISEGYISWGSKLLFCQDNSAAGNDTLRIAYHNGNVAENVSAGYYVWLGDMLIGQGLGNQGGTAINGVVLSATGASGTLSNLSYSNTAYAPTTSFTVGSNPYLVTQAAGNTEMIHTDWMLPALTDHDNAAAKGLEVDFSGAGQAASGASAVNASSPAGEVVVNMTSSGNYYGAVQGLTRASGDVTVNVTGGTAANNAFGVVNGSLTDGNVTMVFSNDVTVKSGSYGSTSGAFMGAFRGNIGGSLNVEVQNATLEGSIYMGVVNTQGSNSIGSVNLVVGPGATVKGDIQGGSTVAGGTINGDINLTVNGGHVTGNIVGSGTAGTVNGDIAITVTGGIIDGSITAKQSSGVTYANGKTGTVTVQGNLAKIGGSITADTVNLKDVAQSEYSDTFDKYKGNINASTVVLDNYTADAVGATLKNGVNLTVKNGTDTALTQNAAIATMNVEAGTKIAFDGGKHTVTNLFADDKSAAKSEVTLKNNAQVTATNLRVGAQGETYSVQDGSSLSITGHGVTIEAAEGGAASLYVDKAPVNGYYTYNIGGNGSNNFVLEDAKVTLSGTAEMKNVLKNSAVVANREDSTITVSNSGNTLTALTAQQGDLVVTNAANSKTTLKEISAEGGNVDIRDLGAGASVSLHDLLIGNSRTVTALVSGASIAADESNVAKVVVTGELNALTGAKLNANLTMATGSTLKVADGGLELGCTLTLNGVINLGEEQLATLASTNYLELFTGVDAITLAADGITDSAAEQTVNAARYFNIPVATVDAAPQTYRLVYSGAGNGGVVSLTVVPEPATATLSLLALAALAARRRRH